MRKQIASLKAPTDIVVRLVTEEVLKICQEGFAQVNAPFKRERGASAWEKHCTGMSCFCVRKAPSFIFRLQGCPQHYTNWFPWFHFESNTACLPSTFLFSLSLHVSNRRSPDRTLHARASLRDRGSDADQQTQGALNEARRAGLRAIEYDIPGCRSQGILESVVECFVSSFAFYFVYCVCLMSYDRAGGGAVVVVVVHALSFAMFSVFCPN